MPVRLTCDLHGPVHNILCAAVDHNLCPALLAISAASTSHEARHGTCSAQQGGDRTEKDHDTTFLPASLQSCPRLASHGCLTGLQGCSVYDMRSQSPQVLRAADALHLGCKTLTPGCCKVIHTDDVNVAHPSCFSSLAASSRRTTLISLVPRFFARAISSLPSTLPHTVLMI